MNGDPIFVEEESDDDDGHLKVNIEPPVDDDGEDESSDLAGKMSTIWRPNVRVSLDDDGEVEDTEAGEEDATNKGVKRKRAPYKGPCEHGVKYRSNCKVCRACPHGRRRSVCKECGGASICVHGRRHSRCKECGGSGLCEHGRQRYQCKECGGSQICEHDRIRSQCKECKRNRSTQQR